MERPPTQSAATPSQIFHPLQVVDNSHLELILSATSGTAQQQRSLYRIKRQRDEQVEAIILESVTTKKASIASISKSLQTLSTQDSTQAPSSTPAQATAPAGTTAPAAAPSAPTRKPKMFRRVETITARMASERGLMAIVDSIRRHKDANVTQQKATAIRKQASSRQARDKVLENTRQQRSTAVTTQSSSEAPQARENGSHALFPLPAGKLSSNNRPDPPSQDEIMRNYMPLVRKFLTTERENEVKNTARKDVEELDSSFDDYTVEIFTEEEADSAANNFEGHAVRVRIEPFDFDLANEYASDDENDSDQNSEDSNDAEHPNNDYPDSDDDSESKHRLFREDDQDEDGDDVMQSSDDEDDAWAPGPARYRAYHQTTADSDGDD